MDNNARGVEHLRENGSKCRNISFEVECSQIFRLFFFDPHPLFSLKKSVAESLNDLILDAKSHYKSQNLTQIERQIMEESDSSQCLANIPQCLANIPQCLANIPQCLANIPQCLANIPSVSRQHS